MQHVSQIIGVFAMALNILSYQGKEQKGVIAFQLGGSTLFAVHFFMLGAYTGGLLNVVAIVRAFVFLKRDVFNSEHIAWFFAFEAIYALSYAATFALFDTPFDAKHAILEILPLIGMTATTAAFRSKSAKSTRLSALISSPSWLVYNIFSRSVGAICCEALSLISVFVGFFRLDKKAERAIDTTANLKDCEAEKNGQNPTDDK